MTNRKKFEKKNVYSTEKTTKLQQQQRNQCREEFFWKRSSKNCIKNITIMNRTE